MKLFLGLSLLFTLNANAGLIPKVIYGIDDRADVYQSTNNLLKELSRSTAAQIYKSNIENDGTDFYLRGDTLQEQGKCSSERFSNQLAVANCSGFLIAPDVLVTAGHCISSESVCEDTYWVFDYANINSEVASYKMNDKQVYSCTTILDRVKDSTTMNDYAVVRLDRAVTDRTPLKIRTAGIVADSTKLAVLGHPSGLPLKITSNAVIRENTNPVYFRTNADTYGGNSGSAVVDMATGIVEGILVRGDTDYEPRGFCDVSVVRSETTGRGEDATRITNIKFRN